MLRLDTKIGYVDSSDPKELKMKSSSLYQTQEVVKEKLEEYRVIFDEKNDSIIYCDFTACDWFPSFNIIELITTRETDIELDGDFVNNFISGKGSFFDKKIFNHIFYNIFVFFPPYGRCRMSLINKKNLSVEDILEKVKETFKNSSQEQLIC